jgi:hypothetical protein
MFEKPIGHLASHESGHVDEIGGAVFSKLYGADKIPGIADAVFTIYEGINYSTTQEQWLKIGVIPFGFTEGDFDDKVNGVRIPGECTTTRTLKQLGVDKAPELQRLKEEIFICDTNNGVPMTALAELVKISGRKMPKGQASSTYMFELTLRWFQTVIEIEKLGHDVSTLEKGEKSLTDMYTAFKKRYKYDKKYQPQCIARIEDAIKKSENNLRRVTELAFIVRAMQRLGIDKDGEKNLSEWVRFLVESMLDDQEAFHVELTRQEKLGEKCGRHKNDKFMVAFAPYRRSGYDLKLKCVLVESDSRLAHKVARRLGAHVVAVRKSDGHVHISCHNDSMPGINMSNVARMLRWSELSPGDRKKADWKSLGVRGNNADAPNWFFFWEGQMVMNGSLTNPNVVSSRLSNAAIMDILLHGFDPVECLKWQKKKRGKKVDDMYVDLQFNGKLSRREWLMTPMGKKARHEHNLFDGKTSRASEELVESAWDR